MSTHARDGDAAPTFQDAAIASLGHSIQLEMTATRDAHLPEPGMRAWRPARPVDHPDCDGAFVLDSDGNNVEAVCRAPQ